MNVRDSGCVGLTLSLVLWPDGVFHSRDEQLGGNNRDYG